MRIPVLLRGFAPLAAFGVVGIGLPLDAYGGVGAQLAVSLVAWLAAIALIERSCGELRRRLVACLWLATAGELFLSLVWGLYDYRLGNVPLFVPPGHMLLMSVGIVLAARPLPRAFVPVTLIAAIVLAACAGSTGRSTLDVALVALLVGCIAAGRSAAERRLYAVMFWLALALELYGTTLGNWQWRPVDGWFGFTSGNPPLAAGAFYCALDLLALAVARRRAGSVPEPTIAMRAGA